MEAALAKPDPCYEHNPGLELAASKDGLSAHTAQRLYKAASQGQLGKAWRQLGKAWRQLRSPPPFADRPGRVACCCTKSSFLVKALKAPLSERSAPLLVGNPRRSSSRMLSAHSRRAVRLTPSCTQSNSGNLLFCPLSIVSVV